MTGGPLASLVLEPRAADNAPLLLAAASGAMYWLGGRRHRRAARRGAIAPDRVRAQRWRTAAFALAAIVAVLALQEPLDGLADRLFWAHMVQHVLLLAVVAPLAVLAAPWMRLWRALALAWRRPLTRWIARGRAALPLRLLARALGRPAVAWTLLAADLLAWHVPAAYDLTLRSEPVHYAEHASFLAFALLAWGQVIDSPPFRGSLEAPRRVAFALGSMLVGWALALALAFASSPWYAPYAHLRHRDGGLSALADQHLGAGVMWVPASLPWALAVFVLLYRWLPDGWWREPPRGAAAPLKGRPAPSPAPAPHARSPALGRSARAPAGARGRRSGATTTIGRTHA